jgi:hypothetical protein
LQEQENCLDAGFDRREELAWLLNCRSRRLAWMLVLTGERSLLGF